MHSYRVDLVSVPQDDTDALTQRVRAISPGHTDLHVEGIEPSEGSGGVAFSFTVHAGGPIGAVAVAVNYASIRLAKAGGRREIQSTHCELGPRWTDPV